MKKGRNRLIVSSALGVAAIVVAIDHTRHQLPEPVEPVMQESGADMDDGSPCTMDESPCSMSESPCSMESPCSIDDSPCSLDTSPCSLDS